MTRSSKKWIDKVSNVFNICPRDGTTTKTVWLQRDDVSRRFNESLWGPGSHVCVDGPTGVGKTSLVTTELHRGKVKHLMVQLTKNMTWQDFCRQLLPTYPGEVRAVAGVEAGISAGLPTAKLKINVGETDDPLKKAQLAEVLAKTWNEHDVASSLKQQGMALFVDDLEKGKDELLDRLSDLCKLLTQTYVSKDAKLILVGSGAIYPKIYDKDSSLDERLMQVSLGAWVSRYYSSRFIRKGLEKLNLRHPWNSSYSSERANAEICNAKIWDAADGLPKALNALGRQIALKGGGRKAVSSTDIIIECENMCQRHWIEIGPRFERLIKYVKKKDSAAAIMQVLYSGGIGSIHKLENIKSLCGNFSEHELEEVIEALTTMDFLVRTGKNREIIFAKHPGPAHTLGVAVQDPDRFPSGNLLGASDIKHAFVPHTDYDDGFSDIKYELEDENLECEEI